jgi:hypothetical protein
VRSKFRKPDFCPGSEPGRQNSGLRNFAPAQLPLRPMRGGGGWIMGRYWMRRMDELRMSELGFVLVFDEWFDECRWVVWDEWLRMKGGD